MNFEDYPSKLETPWSDSTGGSLLDNSCKIKGNGYPFREGNCQNGLPFFLSTLRVGQFSERGWCMKKSKQEVSCKKWQKMYQVYQVTCMQCSIENQTFKIIIGLDKSGYQVNSFLISWRKHVVGASNEYPQHILLLRNKKNVDNFFGWKSALSRAM